MATGEEQRRYRDVIGHFTTGVAIITAHGAEGPAGMTANALCSLSLDPLLVLACFDRTARTLPLVERTRRFAVCVLRHEDHALSGVFASKRPEAEKFEAAPWRLRDGVPVLDRALAWLVCDLTSMHPGGDHMIGVGAVRELGHAENGQPLVWYRGEYGTITLEGPAEAELPD